MRRPLTLRQIDIFRALIETGTVSKAATALNISQPAASKLLGHLEDDAGLKLFDRAKGRLLPTAVALRLYEEVEKVFSGVRQIEKVIDALQRQEQERLTIGVIPALSRFVAPVVAKLLAREPRLAVSVDVRGSQYISEWISSRRVDVGIVSDRMELPDVRSQSVLKRDLVVVVPERHRLAGREEVTMDDLAGENFIHYATLIETQQMIAALFARAGVVPQSRVEVTTAQTMCECVACGVGVGVVHPIVLAGFDGRVVPIPLKPATAVGYQLVWVAQPRNSARIEMLIEAILAEDRAG